MQICCRKCNNTSFYLQQSGMQVGLYCDTCGSWIKWVGKKEQVIYKNRGMKIYAQGTEVQLKKTNGNSIVSPIKNRDSLGLEEGVDTDEVGERFLDFDNESAFGTNPNSSNVDVELEVQRRVAEELQKQGIQAVDSGKKENNLEDVKTGSDYCPICDGSPLEAEAGSKVEVSIFSGVMTVTDIEGTEILGLYRLKRCPNCGKIF